VNSSGVIQAGTCSVGNFQQVWPHDASNDPGVQASTGDLGESDLDIEWMGSVARGANIVFVTSAEGVDDSVSWAVDQDPPLAKVISYSYGLCEALVGPSYIAAEEVVYQQANSEGISFFAASGDTAAALCDDVAGSGSPPAQYGPSVSYPASSAYATGVGGTEFNEGTGTYWGSSSSNNANGGSAQSYIPEIAWDDSAVRTEQGYILAGSGGGASNCVNGSGVHEVDTSEGETSMEICDTPPSGGFPKPSWQSGVTPDDSVRDVPDISFSASNFNNPYIVCTPLSQVGNGSTSTESTCASGINTALVTYNSAFGGTSASTPVTAGMIVLLNQYLAEDGLGLINPQLYSMFAANPSGVFNETQAGDSSTIPGAVSANVVSCTSGDPSFEPSVLQCPSSSTDTSSFGFTVPGGHAYSQVTGVGSVNINNFIVTWAETFTLATAPTSATLYAGQTTSPITITVTPSHGFDFPVTVTCPNPPAGVSCSALTITPNSSNPATGTLAISTDPNMATGAQTVTISATGGAVTETSTVSLTVNTTQESFTLNPPSSTPTVAPGQTATVNLTVSSTSTPSFLTGTSGSQTTVVPVTYTCTGFPSESNCTISPATTTASTISLAITTTAPTSKLQTPFDRGTRIFYATLLPGLVGIVFAFGSPKGTSKLRGMRMLGLIMVLGFSTIWFGSCSGSNNSSSSNPGTPAGSYTITVNATTGGAIPLTSSTQFTLTVN
jgi:hypothetical protein